MKRNGKRMLSAVVALVLVLSLMPVMSFAAEQTTTVYCQAPEGWTQCMVYWWDANGENPGWPGVAMTQNAEGFWGYDIPVAATNVIFNNGEGQQSPDLYMPTGNKVLYLYTSGIWTELYNPVPEVKYYVAGTMNGWVPDDSAYQMTALDDGSYTLTFSVEAGDHELKVTDSTWTNCWGNPANPVDNFIFTTFTAGEVTVTFRDTVVSVEGSCLNKAQYYTIYCQNEFITDVFYVYWWGSTLENPKWPGVSMANGGDGLWIGKVPSDAAGVVFSTENGSQSSDLVGPEHDGYVYYLTSSTGYYVAGDFNNWVENSFDHMLLAQEDGILAVTFAVTAGDHALKITDGTWENSWGIYDYNFPFTITQDSNITVYFEEDTKKITIYGDYVLEYDCGENITIRCRIPEYAAELQVFWYNEAQECIGFAEMMQIDAGLWEGQVPSDAISLQFSWSNVWSQHEPVPPYNGHEFSWLDPVFYVSGDFNNWEPADPNYEMQPMNNGTSKLTFLLPAGNHELKLTCGSWENSWGNGEDNVKFTVLTDSEVTVTIDYVSLQITVTGDYVTQSMIVDAVYAVGVSGLTGAEWNPAANQMTANGRVYTITFENIPAGTYEYKFAANASWDISWGAATDVLSGESYPALLNGGNNVLVVEKDGSCVTLTLDLTNMDFITGSGAVCTAVVEAPQTGVAVRGKVTIGKSTSAGDFTVELFNGSEVAYTVGGTKGAYTIEGVAAGTYTLKISKAGHVTRAYEITVGGEDLTQDGKICPIGDATGDGRVNAGDVAKLFAYTKGGELADDYAKECANANGGKLNIGDVSRIYAHVTGKNPLF